ncbi:Arm DNA-binding domain-containing protein [Saccharospirillum alexandrii]|uniref:Arm DNA-binding domain-containing protein n=1 Tax=Saccharospirillum alexandrii TaxID=2448477 RepID=UPI003736E4F4
MDRKLPRGVTVRGNSLQLSFSYQGQRFRESLRMPDTKPNIKAAELKLAAIQHDIAMGKFDYGLHFPRSKHAMRLSQSLQQSVTIDQILNDWLRRVKERTAYSTLRDYSSAVTYHLIPQFGTLKVMELKSSQVEEWLSSLDISGKRKRNILIPLRQAFEDAVFDGLIEQNPMLRVRNPKHERSEPRPFNQDEVDRILSVLAGVERNLICFAFETGLRTSELIALMWKDVDLESKQIHVRRACVRGHIKETKTSSGWRSVPLSPSAYESLISQQFQRYNHDSFVFYDPKSMKRWGGDQIIRKRVWKKAIQASGVKYRNPYQTRHTYASRLLSQGENPLKVAYQMGHKDWGMIRSVYGRWVK